MTKIISVMNYKGGVGKTTLTANMSAELAYRGNKVLMIDLDPQSNNTGIIAANNEANLKRLINIVSKYIKAPNRECNYKNMLI